MKEKKLIQPHRVRRVPAQFSWLDHRLVRDNHLQRCAPNSWALYLFLVVVADAQGLSYYSEASITGYIQLDLPSLRSARCELIQARLIAYEKPFYQVLDLARDPATDVGTRQGRALSLKELFQQATEAPHD